MLSRVVKPNGETNNELKAALTDLPVFSRIFFRDFWNTESTEGILGEVGSEAGSDLAAELDGACEPTRFDAFKARERKG